MKDFHSLSIPEPNTGCLLWTAGVTGTGYGAFYPSPGKQVRAHRYAYALKHGPIPTGLAVCHRCDTPTCVNPDHLFLGTQIENLADMTAKGRRVLPSFQTHCQRGHELNELTTFTPRDGRRRCLECKRHRQRRLRGAL